MKFLKFVIFGGGLVIFNLVTTLFLTEILHWHYLTAYIIVLSLTVAFGFVLATRFIFKAKQQHIRRFFIYLISVGIFYILDIFLTRNLTEVVGLHYAFSIVIAKLILFLGKFFFYDRFLFKDNSFLFIKKI